MKKRKQASPGRCAAHSKVIYYSRGHAIAGALAASLKTGVGLSVYRATCGYHHLTTHQPERSW